MYAFTAAHKTLPLPSYARVTNLDNGRSVVVRINDRGPFHPGRIIDLSYAAAVKLGYRDKGTARVEVKAWPGRKTTPANRAACSPGRAAAGRARGHRQADAFAAAERRYRDGQAGGCAADRQRERRRTRRARDRGGRSGEPRPALRHAPGRPHHDRGRIRCVDAHAPVRVATGQPGAPDPAGVASVAAKPAPVAAAPVAMAPPPPPATAAAVVAAAAPASGDVTCRSPVSATNRTPGARWPCCRARAFPARSCRTPTSRASAWAVADRAGRGRDRAGTRGQGGGSGVRTAAARQGLTRRTA